MDIKKGGFDGLDIANGKLSENYVPVHVFFMRTTHNTSKTAERMAEKMLAELTVPDFLKSTMAEKIKKLAMAQGQKTELHAIVLAHDTVNDTYVGLAGLGHIHNTGEKHMETPRKLGDIDNREHADVLLSLTEAEIQHGAEWNGDREAAHVIESATLGEFLSKAEAAGIKDDFLLLFPETETMPAAPKAPVISTHMTPQRRKDLVKRFGKANIEALEAKLKGEK